jgi:AcrR family transcriptional regulator
VVRITAIDTHGRRAVERKREILSAASRVFRERGLHGTGMRDIAAELGMAVGNLYYYFENREALLAFCQEDGLDGLLALAARVRELALPVPERLALLIAGHVVLLNEGTPGSLAHLEVEDLREPRRASVLRRRRAYERELRALLAAGVGEGSLRDVDPKVAAMAILGAVNWTVKWFRPEGRQSAREIGESFAQLLVGGLAAAGARRRRPPARELLDELLAAPAADGGTALPAAPRRRRSGAAR